MTAGDRREVLGRAVASRIPHRIGMGSAILGSLLLAGALGVEITDSLVHLEMVLGAVAGGLLIVGAAARPASGLRVGLLLATVLALILTSSAGVRIGDGWIAVLLGLPVAALGVAALLSAADSAREVGHITEERRRARVEGEERERARWARDLHDDTLQELGALQVLLASAQRTPDPDLRDRTLVDASRLLAGQLATLRHLVAELRPLALDQLGLVPSLTSLVRRTIESHPLEVDVSVDLNGERRLPGPVEVAAYRIVQESLRNVVRHAHASRVVVTVNEEPGRLVITVRDDGRGFAGVPVGAAEGHFGVLGMRERAELVGGTFAIERDRAGSGTRVTATLPLERMPVAIRVPGPAAPSSPAPAGV